ncbi:P29 [Hamiltonella phage APSE-1]|uniref:Putative protein p29 n=1 Tax=Acyrthosiphon pisum secondary endosymbiont phage 1 TaxID=2682836 RepID=VP29_BPAPS|nr:hypothetical protein APSE-1_29 [Hamiltonella phage APSE-1]Q9T1R9.1 RecName: Full=Putative protein p29 [Hamiltonella phage APSE-1]AAF03972.1 P29 [Hamiltonella phage APSE-1]
MRRRKRCHRAEIQRDKKADIYPVWIHLPNQLRQIVHPLFVTRCNAPDFDKHQSLHLNHIEGIYPLASLIMPSRYRHIYITLLYLQNKSPDYDSSET